MKQAIKIDTNGYYVEPIIVSDDMENTSDIIVIACPDGLYKPKWTGSAWVEGATQDYIDSLHQPQPPSLSDRLSAAESAISALMGV